MTYFLEKQFIFINGRLEPSCWLFLVRPCKMEYSKIVKFFKAKSNKMLKLEGAIKVFDPSDSKNKDKNLEEWLINLNINDAIVPDFEQYVIYDTYDLQIYVGKTVDLHTNEVFDDKIEKIVKQLNDKHFNKFPDF